MKSGRAKSPSQKAKKEPDKPVWQRFLESSGGAALITVVLGGIFGQVISTSIQKGLKDREFQQEWLKARGDQALASYTQYLAQENDVVQRVYELVGSCLAAASDLIILTTPEFAPGSHTDIAAQRTAIRERWNDVDKRWRSEKDKLGLLMSYYHHGRPEVVEAWDKAQEAVSNHMDCARTWYLEHAAQPGDVSAACEREERTLRERLAELTRSLERSRRYAWEGWESPEQLREALAVER